MLCLARRLNERLVIGKDIVITVIEIRGDLVRLGIEAPRDIPVDREEVRRDKLRNGNRINLFQGMQTTPAPFALG